ncbi:endochitinase Ziz m 1.0101-like [Ziziphus jujuba]|uniref:chitinase n=1 Tax=Ziziphus jujuba TaxID=326968 RepID=A0ABM4AAZ1_ZIZJJ|nr:endochitinase Ziz m 1.0101-like [Ziziphus jujuba]
MAPLAKLVVACLILSLALIQVSWVAGGSIATYWGQDTNDTEGRLEELCNTGHYSHINVAFLTHFGDGRDLEFSIFDHCNNQVSCIRFGRDIKTCQSKQVKILLSIEGPYGTYSLNSVDDAQKVAKLLWDSYLIGVGFDGIDFHIENGSALYYENLTNYLKDYGKKNNKEVILSASPSGLYPDAYLEKAMYSGHFDIVWIQLFNSTSCQYDSANQNDYLPVASWEEWNMLLATGRPLFLGIPASEYISRSEQTDMDPLSPFGVPFFVPSIKSRHVSSKM